jgi:hypothetical protein
VWNDTYQKLEDYKVCPLCASTKIDHLTLLKKEEPNDAS